MPPGAVIEDIALDAQGRQRVIDGTVAALQELYVFPDAVQKMADALSAHVNSGDYDAVTDGTDFAALLTEHLRAVSHDKHLRVTYEPFRKPAGSPEPGAAGGDAQTAKDMQRTNCGFEKVENSSGEYRLSKVQYVCGPGNMQIGCKRSHTFPCSRRCDHLRSS